MVYYNNSVYGFSEEKPGSERRCARQHPIGCPTGEAATVVNGRIPLSLVHRLDRYLDKLETETGLATNRGALIRHALKVFLESKGIEGAHVIVGPRSRRSMSGSHHCCPGIGPPCNLLQVHRLEFANSIRPFLVRPARVELATFRSEVGRSIQLSYGRLSFDA
jgi:hypothetical protein